MRMEAYSNNDVFDDSNSVNKNVRVVSQNAANVSNIDVDERIRKLENCVAEQKREIERLRKTASHGPAGATRGSGQASGLSQTADGPRGDMAAGGRGCSDRLAGNGSGLRRRTDV